MRCASCKHARQVGDNKDSDVFGKGVLTLELILNLEKSMKKMTLEELLKAAWIVEVEDMEDAEDFHSAADKCVFEATLQYRSYNLAIPIDDAVDLNVYEKAVNKIAKELENYWEGDLEAFYEDYVN